MAVVSVREMYGGEVYEYYPLGEHIVAAPGVCGGRPTFKHTRIDVRHVLDCLAAGERPEEITASFRGRVSHEAIMEAQGLAARWGRRLFDAPYVPQDVAA